MSVVIKAESLGKSYRLRHEQQQPYATLRETASAKVKSLFSASKVVNSYEEFWALRDLNFEINEGDRVGIIGRNGAGKSTLLKILSRITEPSTGKVALKGRVASLLEVGTGFHPELTGRENIFLNGSILGMNKAEIKKKFDEIVEFAEIEKFLDTPVKRYSSGMYVRLAFAVAAHLEPEILIVDEVLAVGDAQFQKKCMGKMQDVSGQGRTVLFVSHNIQAVSTLCQSGIVLHKGGVYTQGAIDNCIQDYFGLVKDYSFNENTSKKNRLGRTSGKMVFTKAVGIQQDGKENKMWSFQYNETLRFKFECKVNEECEGLTFYMALKGVMTETIITNLKYTITSRSLKSDEIISFNAAIPARQIRPGHYDLYFAIGNTDGSIWYDVIDGNINLPALIVLPVSDDMHENTGFFTTPFTIENIDVH